MQIPIINGIYVEESDYRTSYPENMIPVPKQQGISAGYLRPAEGIESFATGVGLDRGGINWNGVMYRVSGNQLVMVSKTGVVTQLGVISGSKSVTLDYSFDRLIIVGGNKLYYYSPSLELQQVTDADLGAVHDALWVDGYTMTTDGTSIVVTDLNDPFAVNPLKYGSSEVDPDPVIALIKVRNEPHVINRYTIEAFDNVGGTGFPFARIDGAQVQRGAVGTHSCCLFLDQIAIIGSGRNEAISIYLCGGGQSIKIATREIDQILAEYTEEQLAACYVEPRIYENHNHLMIHFEDKTIVYDAAASQKINEPVWFTLHSSAVRNSLSKYRAKYFTFCYSGWYSGDPTTTNIGRMTTEVASHYGSHIAWEFSTSILYNAGMGLMIRELELVIINGLAEYSTENYISTSYSLDGELWSQDKSRLVGATGNKLKRLVWLNQGSMRNIRLQRFQGTSRARLTASRLEARVEALTV